MAEENKLNQTPETTPAPSAEAPEKAPTTGELLGDVEHYDEEKDDWSTGYYGTGSRQQVTDDVFHKLETGEEFTRDDFIKAELALQDAKLEAGIDLEKEKSPGLIGKYHDWKKNRVRHKVNKKKYLLLCLFLGWCGGKAVCAGGLLHPVLLEHGALLPLRDRPSHCTAHAGR